MAAARLANETALLSLALDQVDAAQVLYRARRHGVPDERVIANGNV